GGRGGTAGPGRPGCGSGAWRRPRGWGGWPGRAPQSRDGGGEGRPPAASCGTRPPKPTAATNVSEQVRHVADRKRPAPSAPLRGLISRRDALIIGAGAAGAAAGLGGGHDKLSAPALAREAHGT